MPVPVTVTVTVTVTVVTEKWTPGCLRQPHRPRRETVQQLAVKEPGWRRFYNSRKKQEASERWQTEFSGKGKLCVQLRRRGRGGGGAVVQCQRSQEVLRVGRLALPTGPHRRSAATNRGRTTSRRNEKGFLTAA